MEKKELNTEDPVYLKISKALGKELALNKNGRIKVQLDLIRTGEEWKLEELTTNSSSRNIDADLDEFKKQLKLTQRRLKAAEQQLIKQEKLASLGLLTAGIAHEIKNPLNFITNFSDISIEYLDEIDEILQYLKEPKEIEEVNALVKDIRSNLTRIRNHGHRAEGIVRSMLLHSRGGNGSFEPVDINALLQEYVNLAFHGMRANKNPINVEIKYSLEPQIEAITLNAESFSRVILNLCKNAFDAMREKVEVTGTSENYKPKLTVTSRTEKNKVQVIIEDNGPGIPEDLKKKILTPFFTTKKGVEGTGLGLSITQEILKEHKASLDIESVEGEFTRFKIELKKEL